MCFIIGNGIFLNATGNGPTDNVLQLNDKADYNLWVNGIDLLC